MNLQMIAPPTLVNYKSRCQIARIITESWGTENLFCASCTENKLSTARTNAQAVDFECARCSANYQLKSSIREPRNRIVDSAYESMRRAIESDRAPNLLVLHYTERLTVRNLLLVPSFCFSVSALEKRRPLGPMARRAGWVGCNILLSAIPPDAKIKLVNDAQKVKPAEVRQQYDRLRALTRINPKARGWTLDVLKMARSFPQKTFTLAQMYSFEAELSALYPRNRNVRPKIRQQLQVLRDLGMLRFISRGRYQFVEKP